MVRVTIEPKGAENVKVLIRMAVENELKMLSVGISRTSSKLSELENKHGMNTREFYNRFNRGELGDDMEYIIWAGEFETLQQLERDYRDLSETEVCS